MAALYPCAGERFGNPELKCPHHTEPAQGRLCFSRASFLDSQQSRTLGKVLSTGSVFGKASQEAGVEGAGEVRPGGEESQYRRVCPRPQGPSSPGLLRGIRCASQSRPPEHKSLATQPPAPHSHSTTVPVTCGQGRRRPRGQK